MKFNVTHSRRSASERMVARTAVIMLALPRSITHGYDGLYSVHLYRITAEQLADYRKVYDATAAEHNEEPCHATQFEVVIAEWG